MTRLFLAETEDTEPEAILIDRTCPRCGEPHGKPKALNSEWEFSVTHSGDYVVVAFCHGLPVGIDLEAAAVNRSQTTWSAVLTPRELDSLQAIDPALQHRAFLRYWTRKEAILKCLGVGLTIEPQQLEVSSPTEAPAIVAMPRELGSEAVVRLYDVDFLPGHVGALAVEGSPVSIQAFVVAPVA
jgi:4'-phosphopantetheinyl transferase